MLNITQNDYNIIKQRYTERYIKIELLDFKYRVVDEISGNMLSCSVSCDADSDLRRSCSVSLVVTDNSFDIKSGGKIWLDKYIKVYVGLKNIRTDEIQWYNQGIYLIDAPTWQYDATNNTLSFSGLDLMSKLTGARNGQLEGVPTVISQGESVREAMIETLELGGFTKYIISECANRDGSIQSVPYDIEIDQGGYVYDILSALRDILPQYQIFFDVDGVFHYELIPSGEDGPVLIDDDIWDSIEISEDISTDFASVKNYIEVYGRTHDPDHYPSAISIESGGSVPSGYTQLTYIQSSGTQFINTGVQVKSTSGFEVDFAAVSTNSIQGLIGGFTYGGYNNNFAMYNNQWVSQYGNNQSYYFGAVDTSRHTVSQNVTTNTLKFDGATIKSDLTFYDNTDRSFKLFCYDGGSSYPQFWPGSFKLYSAKIYDSGTLVRNFVPCKNSDGDIGLYDFVTNQFYENGGTGTLIAGDEVPEATNALIKMTISSLSTLSEYNMIGFTLLTNVSGNIQLSVNSFGAKNLVDSNGDFITSLDANTYYVAQYQSDGTWLFLGHRQAQAIWQDNNPDSPFYVNGPVGKIREVLCGGDYGNIMSDELALERAKIEIYWKCRLNDSITLNIIPIPWIDVNIVVSHAPKNSNEQNRYIIKSYSCDYSSVTSTMSINMITFYPYYPMY